MMRRIAIMIVLLTTALSAAGQAVPFLTIRRDAGEQAFGGAHVASANLLPLKNKTQIPKSIVHVSAAPAKRTAAPQPSPSSMLSPNAASSASAMNAAAAAGASAKESR